MLEPLPPNPIEVQGPEALVREQSLGEQKNNLGTMRTTGYAGQLDPVATLNPPDFSADSIASRTDSVFTEASDSEVTAQMKDSASNGNGMPNTQGIATFTLFAGIAYGLYKWL